MRQKKGKNLRRAISTASVYRSGGRIEDRPAPMEMGRVEHIGTTSGKPEWYPIRPKKIVGEGGGGNTRTFKEVTHPSTTLA